jgi:N-acyl-D-aspartate/D-glutamate deacylase
VSAGKIAAIGQLDGGARREVDARGLVVTPGFVDVHTHYDGQAIWSSRLNPSSCHGVTTAVVGNCGVGFAPCRPDDHELLVRLMEGVEDIPGVVMAAGLDWSWESFPQFLDAIESRPHDIDLAAYLPHSPLRVYVMGERGARRETATRDDLAKMKAIAADAIRVGAIGFSSSRFVMHRTSDNDQIPSYASAAAEVRAVAEGLAEGGGGTLQFIPDIPMNGYEAVLSPFIDIARDTGQPLTFTLSTGNGPLHVWQNAVALVEAANRTGARVTGQVFPRPIGLIAGLELSANPFSLCPSYKAISHLPFTARVAAMRDPDLKARIIAEDPGTGHPLTMMARNWEWMYPIGELPEYEPAPSQSIAATSAARGVSPESEAYDALLRNDGYGLILVALGNFPDGSLDVILQLMKHPNTVVALGDGGAHYGMICDGSYTTFVLTHWVRDRAGERLTLPQAVKALTADTAQTVGLLDRGMLRPGYKADINIIDMQALKLYPPRVVRDLPAGGCRLDQTADGYVATFVSGESIAERGIPTGKLPGRLVRGKQQAVAAH